MRAFYNSYISMAMEITLSNGMIALVDEELYPEIALHRWTATPSNRYKSKGAVTKWYAARWTTKDGVKTKIYMHRQIMKAPKHLVVDHLDGNSLNNQRANLRRCTHKTNMGNRNYAGVDRSDEWA